MRRMFRAFFSLPVLFAGFASSLHAQEVAEPVALDLAAILDLAERPWLDRDLMETELQALLWGYAASPAPVADDVTLADPWFWSISAEFGSPRPDLRTAGALVFCARYGQETRERLASATLSDPSVFRLLRLVQPAHDDADVWPEDAVARVSCMITWDDRRRVEILPVADVRLPLAERFESVTVTGDAEHYGLGWEGYAPLYGPEGYRVEARGGPRNSAAIVDNVVVELRVTHQRISFRSFLRGGGA